MALKKNYSYGLAKLEFGDPTSTGGIATSWDELGYTAEGTCVLNIPIPNTTPIKIEEQDDPLDNLPTEAPVITLKTSTYNTDLESLNLIYGGTLATGTAGVTPDVLEFPDSLPTKYKSVRATTTDGVIIEIPYARLMGELQWDFTRGKTAQVNITSNVLKPKDGTTKKLSIKQLRPA